MRIFLQRYVLSLPPPNDVLLPAILVACVPVTVNVNFPQEKLDDAASQIVDMSRRPGGTQSPGCAAPKPGSSLERWLAPLGPREAAAQERRVQRRAGAQDGQRGAPPARGVAEPAPGRRSSSGWPGDASGRTARASSNPGPGKTAPARSPG